MLGSGHKGQRAWGQRTEVTSSSGGLCPLRGRPSWPREDGGQRGASVATVHEGHHGSPWTPNQDSPHLPCELLAGL